MKQERILTGDRTTGKLHLGHYVGSLQNRVKLQQSYDTLILLADIQALTTHFEQPELIHKSIMDVAMDNLSVGLDANKITMVQQSMVPAIGELTVFYSMLVTVNSLRHNPTIKTEMRQYGYDDVSYGFLGYPVSQAADMTFCQADLIPVGDDQIPHIEASHKIVRRFNQLYAGNKPLIKEPQALLSSTPRLAGLDGNSKMGKSLGNAIYLSDSADDVYQKVKKAVTDPARVRLTDKGNPDNCVVATYQKIFNAKAYPSICEMCKRATIGCVACKQELAISINEVLEPIRERRRYYETHTEDVQDIIQSGTKRAVRLGEETLQQVKEAMHLTI